MATNQGWSKQVRNPHSLPPFLQSALTLISPTLCFTAKPVPLFSTFMLASSSPPRFAPFVTSITISLLTIPWSSIPISPANSTLNTPPINTLSPVFVFVLDTCMIKEEMGYVKSALRRASCHWLVAWKRLCCLCFIWDSDSSSWIGLLQHVQSFDFSGKGNDIGPLTYFFFFFKFLLIMKIIIKKRVES